jgi:hypothetical protein
MLYCLKCDRDVEFNSIALPNSVISSTSVKIIHICKNCGSNDLHSTKADALESARKASEQAEAAANAAKAAEGQALLNKKNSKETIKQVAHGFGMLGVALLGGARYGFIPYEFIYILMCCMAVAYLIAFLI